MKRLIDFYLQSWKNDPFRKPLILRGARQVGKTYAVREFGRSFSSCVEINFELNKKAKMLFDQNLDPQRILQAILGITEKQIIPGQTLLFFDEIQAVPEAITALRYFYEMMPELHIVAAGSLIDFAIQSVGIPVGRVQFLYMYPMSFIEFLASCEKYILIQTILSHSGDHELPEVLHQTALTLLGQYMALGGMPQAVACWNSVQNVLTCAQIPQSLIEAYTYDFVKYGKSHQVKYLDLLFSRIPEQLGKKFKYSLLGDYKKRELEPCIQLLSTACVVKEVVHTDAHGIPLGAQVDHGTFKLILLDIALSQYMLNIKQGDWLINPLEEFINKGAVVESLVGQELLAYENATKKAHLYYWRRDARGSEAEVDYIIQLGKNIIPVEVKSGKGSTLKSMHLFLESHKNSPYGIRFSTHNYSIFDNVHSYPLYAIAGVLAQEDAMVLAALQSLLPQE